MGRFVRVRAGIFSHNVETRQCRCDLLLRVGRKAPLATHPQSFLSLPANAPIEYFDTWISNLF